MLDVVPKQEKQSKNILFYEISILISDFQLNLFSYAKKVFDGTDMYIAKNKNQKKRYKFDYNIDSVLFVPRRGFNY